MCICMKLNFIIKVNLEKIHTYYVGGVGFELNVGSCKIFGYADPNRKPNRKNFGSSIPN